MPVQQTDIAWCDDSANHWVGCAKVSEGCRACWAAAVADRFDRTDAPWTVANVDANLRVYREDISDRLSRRRPAWVFFPSSSDPFLPWLPWHAVDEYLDAIHENPQHCFQVLTKWGPELKLAQGFPEDYELVADTKGDRTKLIGNAVPVGLAHSLCRTLLAPTDAPTLNHYAEGPEPAAEPGVADD